MNKKQNKKKIKTPSKEESIFTKEDFLRDLKKATRPLAPKASRVKEKRKTSA
jgi:hypothetical protein